MSNKFYGVYGTNGYGVYTNWDKVLEGKRYVMGFKVKKFNNYTEAMYYAIDGFQDYNGYNCCCEITRTNWFHRHYV